MNNRGHAQEVTTAANRKVLRIEIKRNRINNLLPFRQGDRDIRQKSRCKSQQKLSRTTSPSTTSKLFYCSYSEDSYILNILGTFSFTFTSFDCKPQTSKIPRDIFPRSDLRCFVRVLTAGACSSGK